MPFRLETFQLDCRANMPTRSGRDLRCRWCNPGLASQEQEHEKQEQGDQEQDQEEEEPGAPGELH